MICRFRLQSMAFFVAASLLAIFIFFPMAALFITASGEELKTGISSPLVYPALLLSLYTTFLALFITVILGTPLAWIIAKTDNRMSRAVEVVLQLPMVIPPAVSGIALLLAFGRHGIFGKLHVNSSASLAFTTTAVVIAETFISSPFYVQAAIIAFRRLNPRLLVVAQTLGASPWKIFFQVALPLSVNGLVSGMAMAWARAMGEFGATLMFAGNMEGKTQTLPLAIYAALESDFRAARALSILLLILAGIVLGISKSLLRKESNRSRKG